MPQTVAGNSGRSSPGAVWHILQIQALALSRCCALPGCETLLIGNLPRRLLPRASAHVAPQRGRHVTLPGPLCARGQRRWHGQQNTVLCDDRSAARRGGLWSSCVRLLLQALLGCRAIPIRTGCALIVGDTL